MKRTRFLIVTASGLLVAAGGLAAASAAGPSDDDAAAKQGRALFVREWLAGDQRSHGGDGLGPVFNGTSCLDCHHQGGVGGAGPNHTNVTLASAVIQREAPATGGGGLLGLLFGNPMRQKKSTAQPDRDKLAKLHPDLRTANSFVVHRFGTDDAFLRWKRGLLAFQQPFVGPMQADGGASAVAEMGEAQTAVLMESAQVFNVGGAGTHTIDGIAVQLLTSRRSAPPLFGAGLIDRVPEEVLQEVAERQSKLAEEPLPAEVSNLNQQVQVFMLPFGGGFMQPLPVSGRVGRLRDGRVGRFGWKAQIASLREFTLDACAVELGLEVPGFPQAVAPWEPDAKAPGLDLTAEECDALIAFVAALPRPVERPAQTEQGAREIAAGRELFEQTGCAVCHQEKLGEIEGIYSDLLLHDMGHALSDSGLYSRFVPSEGVDEQEQAVEPLPELAFFDGTQPDVSKEKLPRFGAAPREWRTPPLWGFADSGPYLHDGRAETLTQAVALHNGESLTSAVRYFRLSTAERRRIELFLRSLVAPGEAR